MSTTMSLVPRAPERARPSTPRRRVPRRQRAALLVLGVAVFTAACSLPTNVAPFPYYGPYGSASGVTTAAQSISDKLLAYIQGWMDGRNPAAIPKDLLPDSQRDVTELNTMTLMRGTPDSTRQFMTRKAAPVNLKASPGAFPDPRATYVIAPNVFVPFGTKIIIDGQFPRARFFDIQAPPAFQPANYRYNSFGVAEEAIVDADINPKAGSVNPYRPGANRNATQRDYQVTFTASATNPVTADPAYKPGYRGPGNNRLTSAIQYRGPWGDPNFSEPSVMADHKGLWTWGEMWLRYYAPDNGAGPLGGVALPKMTFQLPDGRTFWIATDLAAQTAKVNQTSAVPANTPANPPANSSARGWMTNWGILRGGLNSFADAWGVPEGFASAAEYGRIMDKAADGRGQDVTAPGNYQTSATLNNYSVYLNKGMSLDKGKVFVLTGKLPTAPKTLSGNATMTTGQIRYVTFSTYNATDPTSATFGQAITSVIDEELPVNANGYFCLVYSLTADRPSNATIPNGCKWVDWGPMAANVAIMARYVGVGPEWTWPQLPTESATGRATDAQSPNYNPALLDTNTTNGFMGAYQPVAHYMTKQQFQTMGNAINPQTMGYTTGW